MKWLDRVFVEENQMGMLGLKLKATMSFQG